MELPPPETFASRKSSEFQKRAERDLKMKYFKELEKIKTMPKNSPALFKWPSFSTINADDLSSVADISRSLQVSRNSEIVAASSNCKKSLLRSVLQNERGCSKIATSSVKNSSISNAIDIDKKVMPPPLKTIVGRAKSMATLATEHNVENKFNSSREEQSDVSFQGTRTSITFYNWSVQIHKDNLIVKGKIEGESRIVRSQPVQKRLESNRVLSVKSSIYILDGRLIDSNESLPDYIYDKFCNGFPLDWLNVAEVWKTYILQGSPVSFRWPRDIADSDDDLLSEITDIYCDSVPKNSINQPSTSSGYASYAAINEKLDKVNKTFFVEKEKDDTLNSSVESFSKVKTSYLKSFIRKEKISDILGYLNSNNCTSEFEDKFSDLLNTLRYMSTVNFDSTEPEVKKPKLSDNINQESSSPKEYSQDDKKKKSDKSINHNLKDKSSNDFHTTPELETYVCHSNPNTIQNRSTSKSDNKPIVKSVENIVGKNIWPLKPNSNISISDANIPEDVDKSINSAKKIDTYQKVHHSPIKKDSIASQKIPPPIVKQKKIQVELFKKADIRKSRGVSLILSSWYPNLIYLDSGQPKKSLVFEGLLLDKSHRVINDKFCSSAIKMRHSENLLETEDDKMIQLVGNCVDTSQFFSEELSELISKYCKYGCPEDLDKFYKNWLILEQTISKSNTSIAALNLPKSSRGRTIVPRLKYWEGERLRNTSNDVQYFRGRYHNRVFTSRENNNSFKKETRSTNKHVESEDKINKRNVAQKLDDIISLDSDNSDAEAPSDDNFRNHLAKNKNYNTKSKIESKDEENENERPKQGLRMKTKLLRSVDSEITMEFTRENAPLDILSDDQSSIFMN